MKRLDRILSNCGAATRSEARRLITSGRVTVNGTVCVDASAQTPEEAIIALDGIPLDTEELVYIMINKPAGTVCENGAEDSVLLLVPNNLKRPGLFTVGRLDKDTVGLLIITNDGDFAHRVTAPSSEVEKVYIARLEKPVTETDVTAFANGMETKSSSFKPALLVPMSENMAAVMVREGQYHQVKRMFQVRDNSVLALKRVKIGALELDKTLKEGESRRLTQAEKELFL